MSKRNPKPVSEQLSEWGPCHLVGYLSQMLAENAATLHKFGSPDCDQIRAFECDWLDGDGLRRCPTGTWHIGHKSRTDCNIGLPLREQSEPKASFQYTNRRNRVAYRKARADA